MRVSDSISARVCYFCKQRYPDENQIDAVLKSLGVTEWDLEGPHICHDGSNVIVYFEDMKTAVRDYKAVKEALKTVK